MKNKFLRQTMIVIVLGMLPLFYNVGYAENIDPYDDGSQYAYGENVGWLNAEPGGEGGDGVEVDDSELTGYIWAENIGWINLSPISYGGVTNDGNGNLSGYAWGENVGWINFNPTNGGVTIDATGDFNGWAWGENIGWIHFKSELPVAYKVQTAWAPTVSTTSTSTSSSTTTTPHDCDINIYPDALEVPSGNGVDFTASETGNCNNPDYEWTVQSVIGSEIETSSMFQDRCIYWAGTNPDMFNKATDIVRVVDHANNDIYAEAIITVTWKCPLLILYGQDSEKIELLRYFRDNILTQTPEGQEIIKLYYQWSPAIVKAMEEDEAFKEEVKEVIDGVLLLLTEEVK